MCTCAIGCDSDPNSPLTELDAVPGLLPVEPPARHAGACSRATVPEQAPWVSHTSLCPSLGVSSGQEVFSCTEHGSHASSVAQHTLGEGTWCCLIQVSVRVSWVVWPPRSSCRPPSAPPRYLPASSFALLDASVLIGISLQFGGGPWCFGCGHLFPRPTIRLLLSLWDPGPPTPASRPPHHTGFGQPTRLHPGDPLCLWRLSRLLCPPPFEG